MPARNVYVSAEDVPLFERAAEVGGGLSAAVAAGLRLFVAQRDREREGGRMQQVEVEVSKGAVVTVKRFTGRQVLRFEEQDGLRSRTYRVYATAGGQFAVHTREEANWRLFSAPDEGGAGAAVWGDPQVWSGPWWRSGERSLAVFADVAAMAGQLPDALVDAVGAAVAAPAVQELDI